MPPPLLLLLLPVSPRTVKYHRRLLSAWPAGATDAWHTACIARTRCRLQGACLSPFPPPLPNSFPPKIHRLQTSVTGSLFEILKVGYKYGSSYTTSTKVQRVAGWGMPTTWGAGVYMPGVGCVHITIAQPSPAAAEPGRLPLLCRPSRGAPYPRAPPQKFHTPQRCLQTAVHTFARGSTKTQTTLPPGAAPPP